MQQVSAIAPAGTFRGTEQDGVRTWRGIVYAHGERFAAPVKEPDADGEVDACQYGPMCPQRSSRLDALLGAGASLKLEEGPLCLTVQSPAQGEGLPVMVWIHGGAFLTGGSEDPRYGGERLVRCGNLVVVKISYRLGALGYLHLPDKGISNLGLADQKMALEWIQRNISAFGGDPARVTVFGQSAGASSIAALMADGCGGRLFGRAILQSPPLGIGITQKEAAKISRAFIQELRKAAPQLPEQELLLKADTQQILDAQDAVLRRRIKTGMTFMPVIPDYMSTARAGGLEAAVVGYTAQDASPFLAKSLGRLLGSKAGRLIVNAASRRIFGRPCEQYIQRLDKAGVKAVGYRLCWHPEGNAYGACHCMELPFLLGEWEEWKDARMLQGCTRGQWEENSARCLASWTGFAAGGKFEDPGI